MSTVIGLAALVASLLTSSNAAGGPALAVEVQVRIAGRQNAWREFVGARPGTLLEYRMIIHNVGDQRVDGTVIVPNAPEAIQMIPASCTYREAGHRAPCPRGLEGGELHLPLSNGDGEMLVVVEAQLRRGVGGQTQRLSVELDSYETDPKIDSADVVPHVSYRQAAVREFMRAEAEDGTLPRMGFEMTEVVRHKLIHDWPVLGLERVHAFGSVPAGTRVGIRRLDSDHRLEGRIVTVVATVASEPIEYDANRQLRWGLPTIKRVKQRFAIEAKEADRQAWCVTMRHPDHLLRPGDRLVIRAVPIGWIRRGPSASTAILDCAGVRRLR